MEQTISSGISLYSAQTHTHTISHSQSSPSISLSQTYHSMMPEWFPGFHHFLLQVGACSLVEVYHIHEELMFTLLAHTWRLQVLSGCWSNHHLSVRLNLVLGSEVYIIGVPTAGSRAFQKHVEQFPVENLHLPLHLVDFGLVSLEHLVQLVELLQKKKSNWVLLFKILFKATILHTHTHIHTVIYIHTYFYAYQCTCAHTHTALSDRKILLIFSCKKKEK